MNRGIAKRTCFPDASSKRTFMALMACAVRRGELRVEAFVVLDTHFHLMARSTDAHISFAMMRVQNAYVRYFNRRFQRDGPLFRGRFRSIPVDSIRYGQTLLRYIDANAVSAKLTAQAIDYRFGSAHLFARHARRPHWLDRSEIASWVAGRVGTRVLKPELYHRWTSRGRGSDLHDLVRSRLVRGAATGDELDELLELPGPRVAAWMQRKAALADGLQPWTPIALVADVVASVKRMRGRVGKFRVQVGPRKLDAWPLLEAGLLHVGAGLRTVDTARQIGCAASTASRRITAHLELLSRKEGYAACAGEILREAMRRSFGEDRQGGEGRRKRPGTV